MNTDISNNLEIGLDFGEDSFEHNIEDDVEFDEEFIVSPTQDEDEELEIEEANRLAKARRISKERTEDSHVEGDWGVRLSGISSEFTLEEFGKTYKYVRLNDPYNHPTDKFAVFCKLPRYRNGNIIEHSDSWVINNGLVSNRYTVGSLSKFTEFILEELGLENAHPKVIVDYFSSAWYCDLDMEVDMFDGDTSKMMFSIVTGIPVEHLDLVNSRINLFVTNSYNGKGKLRVSYIIKTTVTDSESEGRERRKTISDFFILDDYASEVVHASKISNIASSIIDISSKVETSVETMKNITINNSTATDMAECFNKDERQKFNNIWDTLTDPHRNLFYVSILCSSILDGVFDFPRYYKLRTIIEKVIARNAKSQS